jgi:hypothetical protein
LGDCPTSLRRLLQEIRAKKYSHVVLNIESGSFPAEQHDWIERSLAAVGATVCNIAYEVGPLTAHLAERYGKSLAERAAAWAVGTDDAAEVLALFPGVVASVVGAIFDEWDLRGDTSLARFKAISEGIGEENPYRQDLVPWSTARRVRRLLDEHHRDEETQRQRRRAVETIYKLGPDHTGVLGDDFSSLFHDGVRSPESLAWAKGRLCRDLGFAMVTEGQAVSFRRTLGDVVLFGDPRALGHISFYAYRAVSKMPTRHTSSSIWPAFKIPDGWKRDLETKLHRFVSQLKAHQIQSFRATGEPVTKATPSGRLKRRHTTSR